MKNVVLYILIVLQFILVSANLSAEHNYYDLQRKYQKAMDLWEEGHNTEAFDLFNVTALANHPPSKFMLGLYYLYGFDTVKISYYTAFKYINEAADRGYIHAMLQRSILYYNGIGVQKDFSASERYFKLLEPLTKEFDLETKSFMLVLINVKYKRYSTKTKKRHVWKLIKKLKKSSSRLARINLIYYYRTYLYLYKKAKFFIPFLKKEMTMGNAEAQGAYYEKFHYRKKDKEVIKALHQAGKQGDANSQYNLYLYYKGKKNKKQKIYWLKAAADSGARNADKILRWYGYHQ